MMEGEKPKRERDNPPVVWWDNWFPEEFWRPCPWEERESGRPLSLAEYCNARAKIADEEAERAQQQYAEILEDAEKSGEKDYDKTEKWNEARKGYEDAFSIYTRLITKCWMYREGLSNVLITFSHCLPRYDCPYGYGVAILCNNYANFLYMSRDYKNATAYYERALYASNKLDEMERDAIRRNLEQAKKYAATNS